MYRIIITIFVFIFSSTGCFAILVDCSDFEKILYNGDTLYAENQILRQFSQRKNITDTVKTYRNQRGGNQWCIQYSVDWEIQNDSLFLKNIVGSSTKYSEDIPIKMEDFFPIQAGEKYFTETLDTTIIVKRGKILYDSWDWQESPIREYDGILQIKNGKIISYSETNNKVEKSRYSTHGIRDAFLYKNINWEKISKKELSKNYCVDVVLEFDLYGNVTDAKIYNKRKSNTPEKIEQEVLRVFRLLPQQDVYYRNEKPQERGRILFKMVINKENKKKYFTENQQN